MEQLLPGWTVIWDSQVSSQWNRSTLYPDRALICQSVNRKMQSLGIEEDVEFSQPSSSALLGATPSPQYLFRTVQIINQASQFKPLRAEVDPGSLCTIISRKFLAKHLPKTPMDPLWEVPSNCGVTSIHSLEGTVDIRACLYIPMGWLGSLASLATLF